MTICEICFNCESIYICLCAKSQCFRCTINYGQKCCYCEKFINVFELLLINPDGCDFLVIKNYYYNFIEKMYNEWFLKIKHLQRLMYIWTKKEKLQYSFFNEVLCNLILSKLEHTNDIQYKSFFLKHIDKNEIDKIYFENLNNNTNEKLKFFIYLKHYLNISFEESSCCCNNLTCKICNSTRCYKCLDYHNDTDCNVENISLNNIKFCPTCKNLIIKEGGCDDMWCVHCKTFFSWRQGIIRNDKPHNPDYISYITKNNKILSGLYLKDNPIDEIICFFFKTKCKNIKKIKNKYINFLFLYSLPDTIIKHDSIFQIRNITTIKTIDNIIQNFKKIIGQENINYGNYTIFSWPNIAIDIENKLVKYKF